jgi:predicted ATPase
MAELGLDTGAWGTYLVKLLGLKEGTESLEVLSPEAIKAGTLDTLRLMSLVGSRRRPIVVVVEDCHWIDRTSEEVLTAVVEDLAGAAMLLISTYRPGYRPPWMDKSYATQLSLPPLAAAEGAAIIHALLPELSPSAALTRSLLATAEGNPFFIEELARAMQGPARTQTTLVVPETIPAVIAARIDRLPDESKRLLQAASVLGRECPRRLLTAVWASVTPVDGPLRDLVRHEFLYERADPGDAVYVFKHALTQETAYEMLLGPRRAQLHVAAAQAIESMYADRLPEVFGPLAYHYARTEDAGRAVEYLVCVGDRANATYALPEAVTAYRGALAQVDRLPPTERDRWILRIVLMLAEVLALQGDLPASRDLMLQHEDEVERIDDAELTATGGGPAPVPSARATSPRAAATVSVSAGPTTCSPPNTSGPAISGTPRPRPRAPPTSCAPSAPSDGSALRIGSLA